MSRDLSCLESMMEHWGSDGDHQVGTWSMLCACLWFRSDHVGRVSLHPWRNRGVSALLEKVAAQLAFAIFEWKGIREWEGGLLHKLAFYRISVCSNSCWVERVKPRWTCSSWLMRPRDSQDLVSHCPSWCFLSPNKLRDLLLWPPAVYTRAQLGLVLHFPPLPPRDHIKRSFVKQVYK